MRAVLVIFASCYLNNRYMINLVLKGFEQGSKILEIEAAVLRVMEKSSIRPKEIDTELNVAKTEGHLMMVFVVKEVSFDGLANLKKEFGNDFTLTVVGKTKSELFLGIEAPRESFIFSFLEVSVKLYTGSSTVSPRRRAARLDLISGTSRA